MPKEISPTHPGASRSTCERADKGKTSPNKKDQREGSSKSSISWAEEAFDHSGLSVVPEHAVQGHSEAIEKHASEAANQARIEIEKSRKGKSDISRKFSIKLEAGHEKISAEYPTL